jgi:hypothetical protein
MFILIDFLNESFVLDWMIFFIIVTFVRELIITLFSIHEVNIILTYN